MPMVILPELDFDSEYALNAGDIVILRDSINTNVYAFMYARVVSFVGDNDPFYTLVCLSDGDCIDLMDLSDRSITVGELQSYLMDLDWHIVENGVLKGRSVTIHLT